MATRDNQKQRTRRALIDAAVRLATEGRSPTIPEVAEEALVSTATAYRYFSNTRELMFEVAARQAQPRIEDLVEALPAGPEERIDVLVARIAEFQLESEPLWRAVLGATLERWFAEAEVAESERVPVRGSQRLDAVTAALAPLRDTLPSEELRRLTMATMLVCGVEAMVAARDACGLEPAEAKETMRWAARALQRAALHDHTRNGSAPEPPA
ncbi:TetR/AcrR family transcriptional regulator [Pseudonocardia acaciae]|uniref:TetR/AcrR family transcriptional regulator n=1 Tax=Pseudonocardia acaciae TaxID=551276 RepID=UPI000687B599|nr:TetR/AcrR family transcriptional regulator [Pseudonocardia acaciae]